MVCMMQHGYGCIIVVLKSCLCSLFVFTIECCIFFFFLHVKVHFVLSYREPSMDVDKLLFLDSCDSYLQHIPLKCSLALMKYLCLYIHPLNFFILSLHILFCGIYDPPGLNLPIIMISACFLWYLETQSDAIKHDLSCGHKVDALVFCFFPSHLIFCFPPSHLVFCFCF